MTGPSPKAGFSHPFEHEITRLFCAELSREGPGVEEGPQARDDGVSTPGILGSVHRRIHGG